MENFIKSKEKRRNEMCKFSLILWKYHTKFSSLLRRVSKILKFANLLLSTYKCQTNFKISLVSNFGSKIWAKLQAKPNFSSQLLGVNGILKFENSLTKFINFFLFKKGDKGTWITKPSPYLPLDPTIPSHVQGACDSVLRRMRHLCQTNLHKF